MTRTSQPERAIRILQERGIALEVENENELIVFCPEHEIPELNRLLVESGIPILELSRIRRSLEHLYFNLTAGASA